VFSERDYHRLHIAGLEALGFQVLVLDLSSLLHPSSAATLGAARLQQANVIDCDTLAVALRSLRQFRPDFVWNFMSVDRHRYAPRLTLAVAFKLLARVVTYKVRNGPFVVPDPPGGRGPLWWIRRLAAVIAYSPWKLLRTDYSFIAGAADLRCAAGRPILAHSLDYDRYLEAMRAPSAACVDEPYLLFLDEDYAFHTDYLYMGMAAPVTPEKYFSEVNAILTNVGQALGLRPIIQPHPRTNREQARQYFVHQFSDLPTAMAVRGATLVLTHDSAAVQLAVLMDKPVILCETSEIRQSVFFHANVQSMARALRCPVIGIDDLPFTAGLTRVDRDAFREYVHEFVKTAATPPIPGHELLGQALLQITAGSDASSRPSTGSGRGSA